MRPRIIRAHEMPIYCSKEEAHAALWVLENSKFSGRKHPDVRDFVDRLRNQGIDLKDTSVSRKPSTGSSKPSKG